MHYVLIFNFFCCLTCIRTQFFSEAERNKTHDDTISSLLALNFKRIKHHIWKFKKKPSGPIGRWNESFQKMKDDTFYFISIVRLFSHGYTFVSVLCSWFSLLRFILISISMCSAIETLCSILSFIWTSDPQLVVEYNLCPYPHSSTLCCLLAFYLKSLC